MYIVVTGAAGFIGSNLVKALNARGESRIIAVDNLAQADKFRNLVDCDIADYLDQDEFLDAARRRRLRRRHRGDPAPGRVLGHDGDRRPLHAAQQLSLFGDAARHCQDNDMPFLYASRASVYGAGAMFREERAHEAPLNVYGYSKFLFDQYVRRVLPERTAQIAGFRYFNVYGPREAAQGPHGVGRAGISSTSTAPTGKVQLFEGSGGYAAGEQRRDFVTVDDVSRSTSTSSTIRSARASSISAPGARRASTTSRWRRSTRAAPPTARRRYRSTNCIAPARSSTSRFPPGSPASTRASRRPIWRACAPPAIPRRWRASSRAWRTM